VLQFLVIKHCNQAAAAADDATHAALAAVVGMRCLFHAFRPIAAQIVL